MLEVSFGLFSKKTVRLDSFSLIQYFKTDGPENMAEQFIFSTLFGTWDSYDIYYDGVVYRYSVTGAKVSFVPADRSVGERTFRKIVWNAYLLNRDWIVPMLMNRQNPVVWIRPLKFTAEFWDGKTVRHEISEKRDVDALVMRLKAGSLFI